MLIYAILDTSQKNRPATLVRCSRRVVTLEVT